MCVYVCVCVCVRERERERECVCVCVCEREREREIKMRCVLQQYSTPSLGHSVVFDPDPEMVVNDNVTGVGEAQLESILILQFSSLEILEDCGSWEVVCQPVGRGKHSLINPRHKSAARITVVVLCVCLSVSTYSRTTDTKPAHEQYQQL